MADYVKVKKSSYTGTYIIVLNAGGDDYAETFTGDPQDLADYLNSQLSPVVPEFLLQENSDFLLLESGDKIKLE